MSQMVRLPGYRRKDAPGVEVARLHPTSLTVTETATPLSSAQMELPSDDYEVTAGDFVELFDTVGSLGIYRVSELTYTYERGKRMQSVQLEHAISTFSQGIVFGDLDYSGGTTADAEIFETLVKKQPRKFWQVNEDEEDALEYLQRKDGMYFHDQDLLSALLDFCAFCPSDMIFTYDFSTFPWKIMVMKAPTATDSELRLSRNTERVSITYDFTTLITRLFPTGSGTGEEAMTIKNASKNTGGKVYIDADTSDTWGIVSGTYYYAQAKTANQLYSKAVKYLEKKKNPGMTIKADASVLAAATGESLDRFRAGYKCRLCIPEDNLTLEYQILRVVHSDLCRTPGKATVTLGTQDKRTASLKQAQEKKSGGGGGGGSGASGGGGGGGTEPLIRSYNGTLYFSGPSQNITFVVGSEFSSVATVALVLTDNHGSSIAIKVDGSATFAVNSGTSTSIMGYLTRSGEYNQITRDTNHTITVYGEPTHSVVWRLMISGQKIV